MTTESLIPFRPRTIGDGSNLWKVVRTCKEAKGGLRGLRRANFMPV